MTMTAYIRRTIDRVLNGLTRRSSVDPDMIGRENTMFIAFGIEGLGIGRCTCWATIRWF